MGFRSDVFPVVKEIYDRFKFHWSGFLKAAKSNYQIAAFVEGLAQVRKNFLYLFNQCSSDERFKELFIESAKRIAIILNRLGSGKPCEFAEALYELICSQIDEDFQLELFQPGSLTTGWTVSSWQQGHLETFDFISEFLNRAGFIYQWLKASNLFKGIEGKQLKLSSFKN